MSKEEKAKMLLDVYECEKKRLHTEYRTKCDMLNHRSKFDEHMTPDEVSGELIKVNTWYEERLKEIEQRFLKAILQMEDK